MSLLHTAVLPSLATVTTNTVLNEMHEVQIFYNQCAFGC